MKAAVVHLTEQAKKFLKLNEQVWFGEAFDIPTSVREIPADRLADDFKAQISEAVELYQEVSRRTAEHAESLGDTLATIERRMRAQAECEAQRDTEEEDAAACLAAGYGLAPERHPILNFEI